MANYLKDKLMKQIIVNGNGKEVSMKEIKITFEKFRLSKNDFKPIWKELEKEGKIERHGHNKSIRFKIRERLRL